MSFFTERERASFIEDLEDLQRHLYEFKREQLQDIRCAMRVAMAALDNHLERDR